MKPTLVFFLVLSCLGYSQLPQDLSETSIPDYLRSNSNATVRYDLMHLDIQSFDKIVVTKHRIVTVYNEYGKIHHNAVEFYDDKTKVKDIEAIVYDATGRQIERFKERNFRDESAVSGGTLYSDNRVKHLEYTPPRYPYTLEYRSTIEYKSTAFVPSWMPIDGFYVSVQHSEYHVENTGEIDLKLKTERLEEFKILQKEGIHYVATNLPAIKYEVYHTGIHNLSPRVKVALTDFNMEGVRGYNQTWVDFGQWMYDELLTGTDDVPETAIAEVKALTQGMASNIEKAKAVYQYMQEKTRYISVQVGIGGWKPANASDVDRLGYSDCKGLTNYTRALLEAVGVPSYYTVVWGGQDIRNIDESFSVTEGNHVILCLPTEDENIFLECTSQTNPFGFTAGFTDDRDVLLITPEGGTIVHTNKYSAENSVQSTEALIKLNHTGRIDATINRNYTGYQYALRERFHNLSSEDRDLALKKAWGYLNNLEILKEEVTNDKETIMISERLEVSVPKYGSVSGERIIFQPNAFNRLEELPPRYPDRQLDFKIDRPYIDLESYVIALPENYSIEAIQPSEIIESSFGSYEYAIEVLQENRLRYTRKLLVKDGLYPSDTYNDYREFLKKINKLDKFKVVLKKN